MTSTVVEYIKAYKEKEQLTNTLQLKRDETTSLKQRINNLKDKTKFIQEAYVKEDELRVRVKRFLIEYLCLIIQLKLLDVKNECIDRHISCCKFICKE